MPQVLRLPPMRILSRLLHVREVVTVNVTLSRDVRLGRCQERSPIIHVIKDDAESGDVPFCGQGRIKFFVGSNPTTIEFPESGDVSPVRVEDGPVCSKCLRAMQPKGKSVEEEKEQRRTYGRRPEALLAEKEDALAEHKKAYLSGKLTTDQYYRAARPLESEIAELRARGSEGQVVQEQKAA
ncbi:MAG: hypothetical protein JRN09_09250 [Nitrososphaerota archaeon]|nr:hypothetical protein [Nitrososphaerota archaeon]